MQQKYFISFDGTKIGYQVIGQGKKIIVLCNGLGGTVVAWKPLYDALKDRYRFISWDYRGLFSSDAPNDLSKLTIPDHIRDLQGLLEQENIPSALFFGWSMGVQVCLEAYRTLSKKFKAILLINGTSGSPFENALNSPLSKYILPKVNELASKLTAIIQPHIKPLAQRVIDGKSFVDIIVKLGLVHENINQEILKTVGKEMMSTDLTMYHEIMKHLSEHDAMDLLPNIKVPTLMLAGEKDVLTPMKAAEKIINTIPKAELFVVPGGSHYSLLEFPEIIIPRIEQFLKEHY